MCCKKNLEKKVSALVFSFLLKLAHPVFYKFYNIVSNMYVPRILFAVKGGSEGARAEGPSSQGPPSRMRLKATLLVALCRDQKRKRHRHMFFLQLGFA